MDHSIQPFMRVAFIIFMVLTLIILDSMDEKLTDIRQSSSEARDALICIRQPADASCF